MAGDEQTPDDTNIPSNPEPGGQPAPEAAGDDAPTEAEQAALDAVVQAVRETQQAADEGANPEGEPTPPQAGAPAPAGGDPAAFAYDELGDGASAEDSSDVELLHDVNLNVSIELGRTRMYVEDVLKLGEGSVVELDKLAGDPVEIYVNDRHVARGEVLVMNDNFCVRISEILTVSQKTGGAL